MTQAGQADKKAGDAVPGIEEVKAIAGEGYIHDLFLERYDSLLIIDWNSFNYGCVGSRSTGTEVDNSLVVGPDWKGGPQLLRQPSP